MSNGFHVTHNRSETSEGRDWSSTTRNTRDQKAEALEASDRKHFGINDVRPHIVLTTSPHRETFRCGAGHSRKDNAGRKPMRILFCGKEYPSLNELARDMGWHVSTATKYVRRGFFGPDKFEVLS